MQALLDTHTFLWWISDDARLSKVARAAIAPAQNRIFVSAASAWEVATKVRIGKLASMAPVVERYDDLLAEHRFEPLPVHASHALLSGSLDADHRDPFDRMLAAQSQIERLPLITKDPAFAKFATEVIW